MNANSILGKFSSRERKKWMSLVNHERGQECVVWINARAIDYWKKKSVPILGTDIQAVLAMFGWVEFTAAQRVETWMRCASATLSKREEANCGGEYMLTCVRDSIINHIKPSRIFEDRNESIIMIIKDLRNIKDQNKSKKQKNCRFHWAWKLWGVDKTFVN